MCSNIRCDGRATKQGLRCLNTSEWFVRRYGPKVNVFVDHSDVMSLEPPPGLHAHKQLQHAQKQLGLLFRLTNLLNVMG